MRKSKIKKLNKHVEWLYTLHLAGVKLDMDKLTTKKVYSKYFDREYIVARNQKEVKYIIDRLVSRDNKK
jgi:hypothetical protein